MNSVILRVAAQILKPVFLIFSVFLLLRGHNAPGGGFVGGLVAASAFVLQMIAFDSAEARRHLRFEPHAFLGLGLLCALSSGIWAFFQAKPFLTGLWIKLQIPVFGLLKLGTPALFDLGVYFVVLGGVMFIFLPLKDE
ncbi:MAG TPA: Na+/H+ antiporter subunit B [Candidatus Omnitrophota bacterium]|nr:Na+/H+ antiporter subunit B [Candidatus Omnitrophota bacterium]